MKTKMMVLAMMMMGAMSVNAMAAKTETSHISFQAPYGEWVCIYSDSRETSLRNVTVMVMPDGSVVQNDTVIGTWAEGEDGYLVTTDNYSEYQISAEVVTIEKETMKEIGIDQEAGSLKYRDAEPGAPMLILETIVTDNTDPLMAVEKKGMNYLVRKQNQSSFCEQLLKETEWKMDDSILTIGNKTDGQKTEIELKTENGTEKGKAYLTGGADEAAYVYLMWDNLSPYKYLVTEIEKDSITLTRSDNKDYSIKLVSNEER